MSIPHVPIHVDEERLFAESYERALVWLEAIAPDDVEPVNLDIVSTVATVLGALPEIRALRARIAEELPRFDLEHVDRLEDIARTLGHAHVIHLAACDPPDDLPELYNAGAELRNVLQTDAQALARRGLINEQALDDICGGTGYKNLARDLHILVVVLRAAWPTIEGKCAIDRAELDRAERIALRILRGVGLREQGAAQSSTATEIRSRAFTLLVRTYDNVRQAIGYLRWKQGDADRIAPSLWAGRGGRGRSVRTESAGASDASDAAVAPPPAEAAATPGTAPASDNEDDTLESLTQPSGPTFAP